MVVVAPHPDDEVLGFGGLMQLVAAQGNPVLLIAVTDGEASHPDSTLWPAARLLQMRPMETSFALDTLGMPSVQVVRLGLRDGAVSGNVPALCATLRHLFTEDDVVFVPWILDGHPDHEACNLASSAAAAACGARQVETPIWGWHWATPAAAQMPWQRARKLILPPLIRDRKSCAVQCYLSQIEPDASTGRQPILGANTLAHLLRSYEVYFFGEDFHFGH